MQDFRRNKTELKKSKHIKNERNNSNGIPKLNSTKDTYTTLSKIKLTQEKAQINNNLINSNKKDFNQNKVLNIINESDKEKVVDSNKNLLQNSIKNKKENNNSNSNINSSKNSEITTNANNLTTEKHALNSQNENIYIGKLANGKRNGPGKLIFPDDSQYEGNFKDNEFDGYGVYKCKSYIYKGNYINGKKHGKGKLEDFIKNLVYEGEFSDDKKNGFGIEKYNDGSIYKGDFKNDVKEGKGNLVLHSNKNKGNDIIYTGEFKNNQICGIGEMKISSKKDYYGEWVNYEMNGFGMAHDNNLRHYGYFSHGIKEGYGASFYEDQGFVFVGKWEEDLVTGPSILLILDVEEKNAEKMLEKENIVGMYKGEIIDTKLGDRDINTFKNSEEYQEMTNLFKNKFYPDFLKYIENNKNSINNNSNNE